METKAQKATRAIIEREIQHLIEWAERGGDSVSDHGNYFFRLVGIFDKIDAINRLINEYGTVRNTALTINFPLTYIIL